MKQLTPIALAKAIVLTVFALMPVSFALLLISTSAISPETLFVLYGALIALAFITFATVLIFRPLERFLKNVARYPWFQVPWIREDGGHDRLLVQIGRTLSGAIFQMVAYWLYITILAVFFFAFGEPFSSQPGILLWAAFSGAVVVRLSRYIPDWADRIAALIADFMIPFGVILAIALWVRFGGSVTSPQILEILRFYGPLVFVLFPFYLIADAGCQFLKDRGFLRFT